GRRPHRADAFAAAARGSLEHDRIADALRLAPGLVEIAERRERPLGDRHAGVTRETACLRLFAEPALHLAGRPDEHEARVAHGIREVRVLREESVAGMNGIALGSARDGNELSDREIALAGRS